MSPMNVASVNDMVVRGKQTEASNVGPVAALDALRDEYIMLWKFWRKAEDEVSRLRLEVKRGIEDADS